MFALNSGVVPVLTEIYREVKYCSGWAGPDAKNAGKYPMAEK